MLHDLRPLHGKTIRTSDGDLGPVKDFCFDRNSWAIRYVVAETGSWRARRRVLLPREAFGADALVGAVAATPELRVNLTRKRIADSPAIDLSVPVSRQAEEGLFRHYDLPAYWPANAPRARAENPAESRPGLRNHLPLCTTRAVMDYQIVATDGAVGTVRSFMVDGATWAIRELILETGTWFGARQRVLPLQHIARISYRDFTVFVNLTKRDLRQTTREQLSATNQPLLSVRV